MRSAPAPSPQLAQLETLNMNLLGSGLGPGAWKSKIKSWMVAWMNERIVVNSYWTALY